MGGEAAVSRPLQQSPSFAAQQPCLPKVCGADIELGNFILGLDRYGGTGYHASRALLREIRGLPERSRSRMAA